MYQPLQILINGRFLCQKATGVQKYALGISLALQKKHTEIVVVCPNNTKDLYGLKVKKTGYGNGFFWEQIWLPFFLLFHKKSLLINFCNTAPLLVKNQIVTIHDLAFLKNNQWFSSSFRRWYNFLIPRLCHRSLKILTVSEFIKKEISVEFKISTGKIGVVPNGIPSIEFNDERPFPFRYLFLTGVFNPRKNTTFILSQLADLKKRNYHIVGVGADDDIYSKTEFPKDENLHLFQYVDDRQYYTFMKHADALIFPSGYEGFGIPVLEALILGTPVILPDLPLYRESFGELPLYYVADEPNSFRSALEKIYFHPLSTIESNNLKNKFNFDNSADALLEVVNDLKNG